MSVRRAVVDTNVLVSALINPEGPPALVADAIRKQRLVPVVSAEILSEYDDVLHRLRLPSAHVDDLLANMRALALLVTLPAQPRDAALPDLDDWPFIAAAQTAACPIITGNAQHFPAEAGVEVLSPAQWLAKASTA